MCGPGQVKNILVSGVVTAAVPTIRHVIVLPFKPSSFEITRLTYISTVSVNEEAILQISCNQLAVEPLTTFSANITGGFNQEPHDVFNVTSNIQGEYVFTVGGVSTGLIPANTIVRLAMNLRFNE